MNEEYKKIICTACSNGCSLTLDRKNEETVIVSGNKCMSGVAFAHDKLKNKMPGKFIPALAFKYDAEYLNCLLKSWNKTLQKALPGKFIQGSPNRSIFRSVVELENGEFTVLEELDPTEKDLKENIANNIQHMSLLGIPVNPYIRNTNDTFVVEYDDKFWIMSPYYEGEELDRATYWKDAWRGEELAEFLTKLYHETSHFKFEEAPFSLVEYIEDLMKIIADRHSELIEDLQPVIDHLRKEFFPKYGKLPIGFCHGDPHPMNMIWDKNKIKTAIDWEFCGPKPAIYDVALIIGCVGAETEDSRNGEFLKAFKARIDKNKVFHLNTQALLPLFTLATRFAWLSEWLEADDKEMIEFEVYYMNLLLKELK